MFRPREKIYRIDAWKPLWEFFLFWDSANYFPPSVYVDQNENDIMSYILNFYDGSYKEEIIERKKDLFENNSYMIKNFNGSKAVRVQLGFLVLGEYYAILLKIRSDGSFDSFIRSDSSYPSHCLWEHTPGLEYIYVGDRHV